MESIDFFNQPNPAYNQSLVMPFTHDPQNQNQTNNQTIQESIRKVVDKYYKKK